MSARTIRRAAERRAKKLAAKAGIPFQTVTTASSAAITAPEVEPQPITAEQPPHRNRSGRRARNIISIHSVGSSSRCQSRKRSKILRSAHGRRQSQIQTQRRQTRPHRRLHPLRQRRGRPALRLPRRRISVPLSTRRSGRALSRAIHH